MNIMLLLSGLVLVNKEIDKTPIEKVTPIVEQYKIIPQEVIQRDIQLIAKKNTTKKKATKKKVVKKKASKKKVKKVVKKKKTTKKKVVKKTKKKTYKQTTRVRYNVGEIQSYAHSLVLSYGWSDYDWECLVKLWNRESSWNPNAVNKKSGACGIPQSLPCSKMKSFGSDYRTNYRTQVRWGLNYIKKRYGSPSEAWSHSQRTGWY